MFAKKFLGCEIDTGGGTTYSRVPFLGEMWFERHAVVHGRWWADYLFEGSSIQLFFGKRRLVLDPSLFMAIRRTLKAVQLQAI